MSKTGWKEIISRYYAATGFLHDKEQFQSRWRQLKGQWAFCNTLRYGSGLGRRKDGSVETPDEWWKRNTMVTSRVQCFTGSELHLQFLQLCFCCRVNLI